MTISDLSAFRSMVYECPCCSVTLMSDDNGTRSLCDDCQSADCSPNREGCYDDCQRMTETRVLIRTFLSHSDALRGQETDRADGYRVGDWFAYQGETSYVVTVPASVADVKRDGES